MRRLFCIGIIGCLGCSSAWSQQWTAQDSLWLKRVLAGEDSVRLDPEVKRAIEQQTLINEGTPVGQPQLAPRQELPISKDFSEYIRTDDNPRRKIPLNQLPPNVFWHHNPPFKRLPAVYESIQEELRRNPPKSPSSLATFDLGELTSKKAKRHKQNAKRSATWRGYNNLPTPDVISKQKAFKRQQEEKARREAVAKPDTVVGN